MTVREPEIEAGQRTATEPDSESISVGAPGVATLRP